MESRTADKDRKLFPDEMDKTKDRDPHPEPKKPAGPKNFKGTLAENEEWMRCPYDRSHWFLKPTKHLLNCRVRYETERKLAGKEMDIGICRHNWTHHIPLSKLKEHERKCEDQEVLWTYMVHYMREKRVQKQLMEVRLGLLPPQLPRK